MFSKRSEHDPRKNALTLQLEAIEPAYDLTESNPTRAALPYPTDEILAAFDNSQVRLYAPDPRGLLPAREAIARRLRARGLTVPSQHIFLSSGTSEAYGQLFKLLCDPGDEVLIPQPSYPLFEHLCRLENVHAVPYPLHYDGQWHLGLAELRAAVTSRTRAVLVVSPNNPTGSYLSLSELGALETLGLPIIADEVFGEYSLRDDRGRALSALQSEHALVFALFGLSKQAALPQWKISWTCMRGPSALTTEAAARLELIADTYLSVATPTQLALPRLLKVMEPTTRAIQARLATNLETLRTLVAKADASGASLLDVEGGFYATLRLPQTQSEERWVLDFLEKDSVHVQPGYFFDFHDEAYVVLSLLTPEARLAEGARRILARVHASL